MITIYGICYNEKLMLPFFIKHYRVMFPNCRIVIYDNQSTDASIQIATDNNCEVITYNTNNKLSDEMYLKIKNNCWKTALTDWVLISDIDEHLQIDQEMLANEELNGSTVISFHGYNMVNHENDLNIAGINKGFRATSYDKRYLFNKREIREINYAPGCHKAFPEGVVKLSSINYICRHYKYVNVEYMIKRHAMFAARLSPENLRAGWGGHYQNTEEEIRKEFQEAMDRTS